MKIAKIYLLFCCMIITNVTHAQSPKANANTKAHLPSVTQEFVKNIPIFIHQARALGFSDQDIAETLDKIIKKGLTEQGLADFLKKVEDPQELEEQEEEGSSLLTYIVLGCCGIIVGWLLYELYQDYKLKNTCEVWLNTDPDGAISPQKLKKAEERIIRALKADEEPRNIVKKLASDHEGVCVKARW